MAAVVLGFGAWRLMPTAGEDPSPPPESSTLEAPTASFTASTPPTESLVPSNVPDGADAELNVVDRAGVPASLYDKYWIAGNQAGQLGTTARLVLPDDEAVLAAAGGRVASYKIDPETARPSAGPAGSTIIVRDIRTGATLRSIDAQVRIAYGVMTPSRLFWTGRTVSDSDKATDGGLWAVDLDAPEGAPVAVIAPSDLDETYGPDTVRGAPRLTDNDRTVITLVQSPDRRATDIVDVEALALRTTLKDKYALEVLGNVALVIPIHGDGSERRIRLVDLVSGEDVGPGVGTDEVAWAFAGDVVFYVQHGVSGKDYGIIAIDQAAGTTRELVSDVTLSLNHDLSAPDALVLAPAAWGIDADGKVRQAISILDTTTSQVTENAFEIGNP